MFRFICLCVNLSISYAYPCVCLCVHLFIFLQHVSYETMCVCICVYCLCVSIYHIWINVRIHNCMCLRTCIYKHTYMYNCTLLLLVGHACMREVLSSLQYKEAYDRELMQHSNTIQELLLVKQRLESEQESLAEADEAVRVAEAKLTSSDVSNMCECVCVQVYMCVQVCVCILCVCVYVLIVCVMCVFMWCVCVCVSM